MGDRRLGYAELQREVTDAELRAREGIEDSHTRGISEHAKYLGQSLNGLWIELRHLNTCSYITTMGLPPQPCFGYDGALGRLKTHVLYELREKQERMRPGRSPRRRSQR